jgi:hypothetical protein
MSILVKHKYGLFFCLLMLCLVIIMVLICEKKSSYKDLIANPTPEYFVTIKGNIEPHMPYPMTVMFRASYAAYNPKCAVKQGRLSASGLNAMPAKNVIYSAKPDKQGNYVIKIPIDAYRTGPCDWKIAWIEHAYARNTALNYLRARKLGWGDTISFGEHGSKVGLPSYPVYSGATLICGKRGLDYCLGNTLQGSYVKKVVRNKNYLFIQNIKSK